MLDPSRVITGAVTAGATVIKIESTPVQPFSSLDKKYQPPTQACKVAFVEVAPLGLVHVIFTVSEAFKVKQFPLQIVVEPCVKISISGAGITVTTIVSEYAGQFPPEKTAE
jgi:hypothetical protein